MLNHQEVTEFISGFFGYGNPTAEFWFVGMEEGGGVHELEVQQRLSAWRDLKCGKLVDAVEFHARVERQPSVSLAAELFGESASIQSTWGPLIRFFLRATQDASVATADIKRFQQTEWGRAHSNTCLVELLPLPSPSIADWRYSRWTDVEYLKRRDAYRKHILPRRLASLAALLRENGQKVVFFYGSGYVRHWSELAGINLSQAQAVTIAHNSKGRSLRARIVPKDGNVYIVAIHPAYSNQSCYFERLGDIVRHGRATYVELDA
ncbi:MAG: hypothetical protein IPK82_20540 [Polyangiaceae bacterium]|nr:hypothetical protein [Polyangiaceae bacterium]